MTHDQRKRVLVAITACCLAVLACVFTGSARAEPRPAGGRLIDGPVFGWPVDPPHAIVRRFLAPANPYGPGHRGVDLAGLPGATVYSAGDGVVVFAGQVAERGVVSIDHDVGLRTSYEPVVPAVSAGQRVRRGEVIGALEPGHAGCPVETCLHWGLRRGEVYLDPLPLLRGTRIRLLPLVS